MKTNFQKSELSMRVMICSQKEVTILLLIEKYLCNHITYSLLNVLLNSYILVKNQTKPNQTCNPNHNKKYQS